MLVKSLIYLTFTRLDIIYAVGLVSSYMENPEQDHFITTKWIRRYIKGTMNDGLFYTHAKYANLGGYSDNDYGGHIDDGKNASHYVFHIVLSNIFMVIKEETNSCTLNM